MNIITNVIIEVNILSLPNEIINEIGKNIELPVDTVRFSLVCKDFYNCSDAWKNRWFARMRDVVDEINDIEYRINGCDYDGCDDECTGNCDLNPISSRNRGGIVTHSYNTTNDYIPYNISGDNVLKIEQKFPPNKINKHRRRRLRGPRMQTSDHIIDKIMASNGVSVEVLHDDFDPCDFDDYYYMVMYMALYH